MILVRYNELALKKGNRAWFEKVLIHNIQRQIKSEMGDPEFKVSVTLSRGRILVDLPLDQTVKRALEKTFGVDSFSPIIHCETDLDVIKKEALSATRDYLERHPFPEHFRVLTRRSEKALKEDSMQIDRDVANFLLKEFPKLNVKLKKPEFTVGIEIRDKKSYIWVEKFSGPKGLPVGTNGKVLTLLSGGIDSPVAAIQIMKRGCTAHFIHFYGTPFVDEDALTKVKDLAKVVRHFSPHQIQLFVVPFGKIQEKIAIATEPKFRTLLYRRLMVKIANRVARWVKAQALITGESLGQVASQTIENLNVTNSVSDLPIFRPLIAYDKEQIIEYAQLWNTFDISIRPSEDCCTLFADRHPAIRGSIEILEEEEKKFPEEQFIEEALKLTTKIAL